MQIFDIIIGSIKSVMIIDIAFVIKLIQPWGCLRAVECVNLEVEVNMYVNINWNNFYIK